MLEMVVGKDSKEIIDFSLMYKVSMRSLSS